MGAGSWARWVENQEQIGDVMVGWTHLSEHIDPTALWVTNESEHVSSNKSCGLSLSLRHTHTTIDFKRRSRSGKILCHFSFLGKNYFHSHLKVFSLMDTTTKSLLKCHSQSVETEPIKFFYFFPNFSFSAATKDVRKWPGIDLI